MTRKYCNKSVSQKEMGPDRSVHRLISNCDAYFLIFVQLYLQMSYLRFNLFFFIIKLHSLECKIIHLHTPYKVVHTKWFPHSRAVKRSERMGGRMCKIVHFLSVHQNCDQIYFQIIYKVIYGKCFNSNVQTIIYEKQF